MRTSKSFGIMLSMVALLFILTPLPIQAAPAPHELILNHETKQCGGYWYGDEYGQNEFPEGWSRYDLRNLKYGDEYKLTAKTEIGTCAYTDQEPFNYSDCCSQLGYEYVSDQVSIEKESNNEEPSEKQSDNFFAKLINFFSELFN